MLYYIIVRDFIFNRICDCIDECQFHPSYSVKYFLTLALALAPYSTTDNEGYAKFK